MKKLFIVLAVVAITSSAAFAQRPVAGAKGFTFGIDGIDAFGLGGTSNTPAAKGSLLFRYYLADDLALRVGLNLEKESSTDNFKDIAEGSKTEEKERASAFGLALGIQKSLGESEKLEPYVGLDLLVGRTGGKESFRTDYDGTGTVFGARDAGDFEETETKLASVMYLGAAPVVGFNYYFAENFAFGAEFNWSVVRQGTGEFETTSSDRTFGVTTIDPVVTGDKSSTTNFGVANVGAGAKVTVTVLF